MISLAAFREVWLVDFEFTQPDGETPRPICLVAREYRSNRLIRIVADDLGRLPRPPYSVGPESLFVAYYASAELSCHLTLGWPMPKRVLDLYVEFRCLSSGLPVPAGFGLLGALVAHGLNAMEAIEKENMRNLALRGGPYTEEEQTSLLDYCQADVDSLARLLPAMLPEIDVPRALLRGRYMAAAARMERTGVPIDVPILTSLQHHWSDIRTHLVSEVDRDFGVYEGETFKTVRFAEYLCRECISWPRLESGNLALDQETFKKMVRVYPQLTPLHQLRQTLAELRLNRLAVGSDGRNRCLLSAFGTKTGRNAPSNSKFIFGLPAWTRSLIKPKPEQGLAYIDYEQQEFGIAAALSADPEMLNAYRSGDPYLAFAKQARAVPPHATKKSHAVVREQFKVCALAVQYGMKEASLARALGKSISHARELLRLHRETYPTFWRWSDDVVCYAMLKGQLHTVFGWRVHSGSNPNPRSLMNFPMQGNGAEMLRLACCLATERGISVCAPVHDAILVEARNEAIAETVQAAEQAMLEASELVLPGFPLRTDAKVIQYPDRYTDGRGAEMWQRVMSILKSLGARPCAPHLRIYA